jgi:hypothetical protein
MRFLKALTIGVLWGSWTMAWRVALFPFLVLGAAATRGGDDRFEEWVWGMLERCEGKR